MAPKKKEVQKLTLTEFMQDDTFGGSGNWADEVEETYGTQALPPLERGGRTGGLSSFGGGDRYAGYARQEREYPTELPTKPPYTAHLGNLSYDANQEDVTDFFADCEVVSVRIVEDRAEGRPKGFGYAEFATVDGLKKALLLDGESFHSRNIRIRIAEPPKDRYGNESNRDLSDWSRKGPLPPDPSRENRRGPREFEPRAPREGGPDEGRYREVTWERKGPLSPLAAPPPMERGGSRGGSRSRPLDDSRGDFRSQRRASPAAWGPGERSQEGSRPPRREERERPAPSAAELDNQWRTKMRPDPIASKSPASSRPASEAPTSPSMAPAAPAAPAGRPRLNLQKRTVSEAPGIMSPSLASDSKASPFGAARPIDTAAREREIAEKKEKEALEKKEAEEKAKDERRLAKEAAAAEAEKAEKAAAEAAATNGDAEKTEPPVAAEPSNDTPQPAEPESTDAPENAADASEQKVPIRSPEPREAREPIKPSRATESGNWRSAGGRGAPSGPRGDRRGSGARGGRGFEERQPSRGGRGFEERQPSRGGGRGFEERQPSRGGGRGFEERQPSRRGGEPSTPTTPQTDADGWTTVSAPAKGRRGRPVVS